jgi:hypothetical protein
VNIPTSDFRHLKLAAFGPLGTFERLNLDQFSKLKSPAQCGYSGSPTITTCGGVPSIG